MTMSQEQTSTSPIPRLWPRFSPVRVALKAIRILVALQAFTVAVLQVIAAVRKRYRRKKGFPHLHFDEVRVGENFLQLYSYGRHLYDDMLAAIDSAQESIYLESFIWKGDAIGREFKMHLAQKAAQGVDVYVIFDGFGN